MDKKEYVIYLDGHEWCKRNTEEEALYECLSYDGDHEIWYEEEQKEG